MCGRYILTLTGQALADAFELDDAPAHTPRYNVAPTQTVPVIRATEEGRRACVLQRWGLVPFWADDPAIGNRLINARAETAAGKPAFRAAFRHRRCLVPADGFFEWHKEGGGKQPYLVRFSDGRPFAFAGLWERWSSSGETPLETFTILTTSPNQLVQPLHDRMPVILPPNHYDRWLGLAEPTSGDLQDLLGPYPHGEMEARRVSRRVSSPTNDDPAVLDPVD